MSVPWASSGAIKIERAKEHLGNLVTEIQAFMKSSPYGSVTEDDTERGEWVFRAVVPQEPPPRWGAIVGDTIHNLRSALDILWRAVFPTGTKDANRRDPFPFFQSSDAFEHRFRRVKNTTQQRVVDILRGAKPYKGGNKYLWALHVLDAEDKHHLLLPVGIAVPNIITNTVSFPMLPFPMPFKSPRINISFVRPLPTPVYPVHHGTELYRLPINPEGPQVDMNQKFSFGIAFGEGEVMEGEAIVPTLRQFTNVVDGLVQSFIGAGLLI